MAHITLRALLVNSDEPGTNAAMVDELQRSGALSSPECVMAFRAVDRKHYWVEGSGAIAYADMPLRSGRLHQSAPHIYARALEALLPLQPGFSFLNIGSGTGYFSSLVAELVGPDSVNDGIDIWPETLEHARERCSSAGKQGIEFGLGNVYNLDVNVGMRYDRIYIGACVSERAQYLCELLEIGGILVGPFQAGHSQQLRKIRRVSEGQFSTEVLNAVHFAALVEPPPSYTPAQAEALLGAGAASTSEAPASLSSSSSIGSMASSMALPPTPRDVGCAPVAGLPGVPFTFALRHQPWCPDRSWAYPTAFRLVVAAVTTGCAANPRAICLPAEVWTKHILPWCPRWWFEPDRPPPPPSIPSRALSALATAGDAVRRALLRSGSDASARKASSSSLGSTRASAASLVGGDERSTGSADSEGGAPSANHSDPLLGEEDGLEHPPATASAFVAGGAELQQQQQQQQQRLQAAGLLAALLQDDDRRDDGWGSGAGAQASFPRPGFFGRGGVGAGEAGAEENSRGSRRSRPVGLAGRAMRRVWRCLVRCCAASAALPSGADGAGAGAAEPLRGADEGGIEGGGQGGGGRSTGRRRCSGLRRLANWLVPPAFLSGFQRPAGERAPPEDEEPMAVAIIDPSASYL